MTCNNAQRRVLPASQQHFQVPGKYLQMFWVLESLDLLVVEFQILKQEKSGELKAYDVDNYCSCLCGSSSMYQLCSEVVFNYLSDCD